MHCCNAINEVMAKIIPNEWCWFPKGMNVLIRANLDWVKRDKNAKGPIYVGVRVNGEEIYLEAEDIGLMDNVRLVALDTRERRRVWLETDDGVMCKLCNN